MDTAECLLLQSRREPFLQCMYPFDAELKAARQAGIIVCLLLCITRWWSVALVLSAGLCCEEISAVFFTTWAPRCAAYLISFLWVNNSPDAYAVILVLWVLVTEVYVSNHFAVHWTPC